MTEIITYCSSLRQNPLAGVELWSMIKNGQLDNPEGLSIWEQFYALAA
ncbi:hypothetical protein [Vibrio lentus]|nr:hypothetical protein [Vibrio lentus]